MNHHTDKNCLKINTNNEPFSKLTRKKSIDDSILVESPTAIGLAPPLITQIELADIEAAIQEEDHVEQLGDHRRISLLTDEHEQQAQKQDKEQHVSYLYSNYEKAKKFLLQKNYFSSLTNNHKTNANVNVYEELKYYLRDLKNHFQFIVETKPLPLQTSPDSKATLDYKLYKLSTSYLNNLEKCIYYNKILQMNAYKYDYDVNCPANGYRSLGHLLEKCCENTLVTMKQIYAQKSFFMFYMKYTMFTSELKDLEAWFNLIDKIQIMLEIGVEAQKLTATTNELFINYNKLPRHYEEMLLLLSTKYQDAFYGRTCCFQYCNSLKIPLTAFAVALASYNDTYEVPDASTIRKTAKSLSDSTKYFMNPELRAKKIAYIMQSSTVDFCKYFSRLTDSQIFHVKKTFLFI